MSMDVMGLEKELIKGVEIGGVAYYLGETEDSNLTCLFNNWFIFSAKHQAVLLN